MLCNDQTSSIDNLKRCLEQERAENRRLTLMNVKPSLPTKSWSAWIEFGEFFPEWNSFTEDAGDGQLRYHLDIWIFPLLTLKVIVKK